MIINLLKEEITDLKTKESNKDHLITELNKKVKNLQNFRKEFKNSKYHYKTRLNFNNFEEIPENGFLENNIKTVNDNFYNLTEEINDINIQNFEIQFHSLQYFEKNSNFVIPKNFNINFNDIINNEHFSEEILFNFNQELEEENICDRFFFNKILNLRYKNNNNRIIFKWQLDPFISDQNINNQFLLHIYFTKLLNDEKLKIYFSDSKNNINFAYTEFDLKHFFRKGKNDQICSLVLPLFFLDETNNDRYKNLNKEIGKINIVLVNRVDQRGLRKRERFLKKSNNLRIINFMENNNTQLRNNNKKKFLVTKKKKKN